jgi:hypothetical protein
MEKVAIVTYNRIGREYGNQEYKNGVMKGENKEIHIFQNERGTFAEWRSEGSPMGETMARAARADAARGVTGKLKLEELDRIYLYVGASGGEKAIEQTRDLPASKITYVMCDCDIRHKRNLIKVIGNADARVIRSECGGNYTLERILNTEVENI